MAAPHTDRRGLDSRTGLDPYTKREHMGVGVNGRPAKKRPPPVQRLGASQVHMYPAVYYWS